METIITGTDLLDIGFEEGKILGLTLDVLEHTTAYNEVPKHELLALLQKLKDYPENFLDDAVLGAIATAMVEAANAPVDDTIALNEDADKYAIYGADYIEEGARTQMNVAMKLPV